MNLEAWFIEIISDRPRGVVARTVAGMLALGEPVYRQVVAARNAQYDQRQRPIAAVDVPVISVGNLTTGGTGKTPVVASIVNDLRSGGGKPGIASRGYRSAGPDGNDELRVLAALCPGIAHRQDRDRATAARLLIEQDACDAVVLDDGFQHRGLGRDLDIVVVDATNPWGYGRLLPRGLLREPVASLSRADLVLVTRTDLAPDGAVTAIDAVVRKETRATLVHSRFVPRGWIGLGGSVQALDEFRIERAAAFAGIGNPEAFLGTLKSTGIALAPDELLKFPDHHPYSRADLCHIDQLAQQLGAEAILCTLKDLVKLPARVATAIPIWALQIGLEITDGASEWEAALNGAWRRTDRADRD